MSTAPVILLFLRLPRFPTLDNLWSNLAETRRLRRRFTLCDDGREYAARFGIYTREQFERVLVGLRLRERLLESRTAREQAKENARIHHALRWTRGERS